MHNIVYLFTALGHLKSKQLWKKNICTHNEEWTSIQNQQNPMAESLDMQREKENIQQHKFEHFLIR